MLKFSVRPLMGTWTPPPPPLPHQRKFSGSAHELDIPYMQIGNKGHIMRKLTFCKCENKGEDQLRSNCEADQPLCFRYRIEPFLYFLNPNFPASSHLPDYTAWFVSDLFKNHIVGFLMTQLIRHLDLERA